MSPSDETASFEDCSFFFRIPTKRFQGSSCGIVVNMLDCDFTVETSVILLFSFSD